MQGIIEKIQELKKSRNAVILAHNYQRGEIQDIADFTGDSLGLSQQAAATDADVIVFCGVHFMAETAAILSPGKTVLLPDPESGCPMADMITADGLREMKAKHPGARVVCYVNTSAAVKAESDICCTSSNAERVVSSIPEEEEIIFIPDKSLGAYVALKLGRKMTFWPGFCPTHHRILAQNVEKRRQEYPNAKVAVHPECTGDVIELADIVASTTGIVRYCRESDAKEIIVGTENGIIHRLKKENPGKTFIPTTEQATCPNMKKNTLEKLLWCLEDMDGENVITVPEEVVERARLAIEKMLELSEPSPALKG
ncbi:MAG: quinolinate synthase NadA [Candidatus Brocadiales bacterium]|nr:quinolinate synthase NadA [Candidatus Bathyanammoxibius sp.]